MSLHAPLEAGRCPPLWSGGPDPAGYYSFPQRRQDTAALVKNSLLPGNPKVHTQYPISTVKHKQGRD